MPDQVRSARPFAGLIRLSAVTCVVTVVGCASWFGREPSLQNHLVTYYDNLATQVAHLDPSIQSNVPAPTIGNGRELIPPKPENRWLMPLDEAIRMAIQNNKIIRQNAQYMSPTNPVMQSPDSVPSVWDPLITNTGILFGTRGTPAALSDFDPRVSVTVKSGADQNVDNTTNLAPPNQVLDNNYAQVQSKVEQQLLGGGIVSINQNWNYAESNQPLQLFNSSFTGVLGAEFRQPLWSGSGRTFTSIAGPISQKARGFSNVSQGVVVAHLNKRLSEIDLQENLQNMLREVGDLYWTLYQNYQEYEAEQANAQIAEDLWNVMKSRKNFEGGVDLAQSEDAYYEAKGREEQALSNLYLTESQFRRLIGVPLDDTRLIYPSEIPHEEEMKLNRAMCLYEALVNRTELTRQKTNLHSLQLQHCAARKLVAPRFDFVSGGSLNGFGHNLLAPDTTNFNSAASNLWTGRENSWSAGFEYSVPLWLRSEKSQVNQLEFRILKARAALAIQEDEIAHELNTVMIRIKAAHATSQRALGRMQAAHNRVVAAGSVTAGGLKNSDIYLRALMSYTQAKLVYAQKISDYNKNLRDMLFRIGRLLPADGVQILTVDGLPLLPAVNPQAPFDDLKKPPDPDEELQKEKQPEDKFPKPKKTPVAEAEDDYLPEVANEDNEVLRLLRMESDADDNDASDDGDGKATVSPVNFELPPLPTDELPVSSTKSGK